MFSSAGATSDVAPVFLRCTKQDVGADLLWRASLLAPGCVAPPKKLSDCYAAKREQAPSPQQARSHRVIPAATPQLTCDADDAVRRQCGWAPVAVEARSSRVQRQRRGASSGFSLSWLPPLRVMLVGASSVAFSYTDSSPKSQALLERKHNELLLN